MQFNLQILWEKIAILPAVFPDGRRGDEQVYPWPVAMLGFYHFKHLRKRRIPLRWLRRAIPVMLAWWVMPVMAVFFAWWRWEEAGPYYRSIHLGIVGAAAIIAAYFQLLGRITLRGTVGDSRWPILSLINNGWSTVKGDTRESIGRLVNKLKGFVGKFRT